MRGELAVIAGTQKMTVLPVAGRAGALIEGVQLSKDVPAATMAAIRSALLEHKVVFFRDQNLTDLDQERFAERLGSPSRHPNVPLVEGTDYLLELDGDKGGRTNHWHTDMTFMDAYPAFTMLRAVESPVAGGDTLWANTAAAYQNMPVALRSLADQLWVIHSNVFQAVRPGRSSEQIKKSQQLYAATVLESHHPLVRVHPETGERTLVLGDFALRFIDFDKDASDRLYELFQGYITSPENVVRWRWRAGDVTIWDNRATQHYAVDDYGAQRRLMRRVTVEGDVPVGVDGRRSIAAMKLVSAPVKASDV